jgi:inorganic phosphate transporter, PiT family
MEGGLLLIVLIALGWVYAYYIGANDSANSIAASISCRALSPDQAVLLASGMTFVGAFAGTEVAKTIGTGLIASEYMTMAVVLSAIIGAIAWTAFATHTGMPVSMTHSIIGGIIGAGLSSGAIAAIQWAGLSRVVTGLVVSPIAGLVGGLIVVLILLNIFKNWHPFRATKFFSRGQILSTGFLSFSFGMNNTQNAAGVIAAALLAAGVTETFTIPLWVTASCAGAIGLGMYFGGRNVIRTAGMRIANIKPVDGFAADATSAGVIYGASVLGIPVSTTHVSVSAIMGVGGSRRLSALRFDVIRRILYTWALTIPASAITAACIYQLSRLLF